MTKKKMQAQTAATGSPGLSTGNAVDRPAKPDLQDRRRKKLRDLLDDALNDPNALQGNLRATVGDILGMAGRLGRAIERRLEASPDAVEEFKKLAPSMEMFVKLTRQADRFAQIDCRLIQARQAKENRSSR